MVGVSVEDGEEIRFDEIRECYEELGNKAIFEPSNIKFLMEFDEIATRDPNLKIHINIFIYDGELEGELTIVKKLKVLCSLEKKMILVFYLIL